MSAFKTSEDIIDFSIGAPGKKLLEQAHQLFQKSSEKFNEKCDDAHFQYGANRGSPEFLDNLAEFLSSEYQDHVTSDRLLLTSGATQGLHLIASTQLNMKEGVVFVENPTYFLALDILANDVGLKVVGMDHELSNVESLIVENKPKKTDFNTKDEKYWGMMYLIPTYHNPTGGCLDEQKIEYLLKMAEKHNFLIVCDDVYNLLYYDVECPKRMLHNFKNSPNLISNGSFSKIYCPGLRLGWIEATPRTLLEISEGGILRSGGAVNNVMSGILACSMRDGSLRKHVQSLRFEYGQRMKKLCNYLEENLPPDFKFQKPHGGYFIWVLGPSGFNATKFFQLCTNEKFKILVGERASSFRNSECAKLKCLNAIRLSIAFYEEEDLIKGAERLCQALRKFIGSEVACSESLLVEK